MKEAVVDPMRSVIVWLLAVCGAVAMAPWFSGGEEPLAHLIGGGALLVGALFIWREPAVRRLAAGPLVWTYLALTVWGALSLTWTVNRYSTILWVVNIVTMGLMFRLGYSLAGEKTGRDRLIKLYLASALAFCGYGLYLYVTGDYERLTSSFYWANPAAAYLIPAIIIAIDRLGQAKRSNWSWIGVAASLLASFTLTDSRGATVVLLPIALLFVIIRPTKLRFWIHLLFTIMLASILTLSLIQLRVFDHHEGKNAKSTVTVVAPGSRFAAATAGESSSFSDRINYLHSAASIWLRNPLGGAGAGTFGDVHPQYQIKVVSAATNAHNIYVQTLAELGLVGFGLLIVLVGIVLVGAIRGLLGDASGLPLFFGLVGLLVHFGLDIDAHYPTLLLLAATLAGLLYEQRYRDPKRASWRLLLVAVLVMVPLISLYQSDVWRQKGVIAQSDGDYPSASAYFANAHHGLVYNPDVISAEGIDYYTVAVGGGADAKLAATLALDRARMAQQQDPSDGQHHQLEGRVLWAQGNLADAGKAFKEALLLDPFNHPDYAYDLASVQAAQGNVTDALVTTANMLGYYPASVITNRNADRTVRSSVAHLAALQGNIEFKQGNIAAAQRSANLGIAIEPSNLRTRALINQINKLKP